MKFDLSLRDSSTEQESAGTRMKAEEPRLHFGFYSVTYLQNTGGRTTDEGKERRPRMTHKSCVFNITPVLKKSAMNTDVVHIEVHLAFALMCRKLTDPFEL